MNAKHDYFFGELNITINKFMTIEYIGSGEKCVFADRRRLLQITHETQIAATPLSAVKKVDSSSITLHISK